MNKRFVLNGLFLAVVLAVALVGFSQEEGAEDAINIWLGGETTVSSLPNIGFAPTVKAQWHQYVLSYSVAIMTQQEGWLNFELGILGKSFSYTVFQKAFVSQFYAELYSSVMARDVQNQSFLSFRLGIIGGLRTPLTEKISCDLKVGIGLGTDLMARLWGRIGVHVLLWSF